jgi:O-antigen/teichoic acid export membrane protein
MSRDGVFSGKRFRGAVRAFLFGRAAQGLANLVLTLAMVRLLAPGDYGAYMILWGMVEMMVPLTSLGMLEAVRRYLPELAAHGAPGALSAFVRGMTLIRLGLMLGWAVAIALFWGEIAAWLGFSAVQQQAALPAVVLVVSVIAFRYAAEMLECLLEQRWSQLTHALLPIGRLAGVVALVATGSLSLAHVIWVDIAVSVGCLLLAEVFLARKVRAIPAAGDYRAPRREVATFAWHMAGVNVLNATASFGALRLLVARFLGLEAAGLFAFIQQLLVIVARYLPANLLANVIRPMLIARHAAGETAVVAQGLGLMWKTNLLIVLCCVAALWVAGDAIIAFVSGGRFEGAGTVALLLFLGLGATTQGQLFVMAMQIHNRTRELRNLTLLMLLVPLGAWAGADFGLAGVALGIVLAQWAWNSLVLWWMRRHRVSGKLDWSGLARAGVGGLAATGPAWLVVGPSREWAALAILAVLLPIAFWLAKPLVASDMDLLQRGLRGWARFLRPFVRSA